MKVKYDKKIDALYIRFQGGSKEVKKTSQLEDFLIVDIGKRGELYGIEVLNASLHLPLNNSIFWKFIRKRGEKKG